MINSESSIKDLNISVRATNCLMRANMSTVSELLERWPDISHIRNLSQNNYNEIGQTLLSEGLIKSFIIPKFNIHNLDQIWKAFNEINGSYFVVDNAKDLIKMTNNEDTCWEAALVPMVEMAVEVIPMLLREIERLRQDNAKLIKELYE